MQAAPTVVGGAAACAAEASDGPHAGLVVDAGAGAATFCVALDAPTVSGIHLIELAASQYGLQYRLGFGGKAVCQLDGIGPDGDDCFAQYPNFWGYWHGVGDDGWAWASTGAGSGRIGDGGLDGWTWGSGDTGGTHPPPPPLGIAEVCGPEPSPSPTVTPTHPPPSKPPPTETPPPSGAPTTPPQPESPPSSAGEAPEGSSPSPGSGTAASSPTGAGAPSPGPSETPGAPLATPSATPVAAAANDAGSGPPLGAVLALATMVVLGIGGALRLRAGRAARDRPPP
jgi:hypothetical protein